MSMNDPHDQDAMTSWLPDPDAPPLFGVYREGGIRRTLCYTWWQRLRRRLFSMKYHERKGSK